MKEFFNKQFTWEKTRIYVKWANLIVLAGDMILGIWNKDAGWAFGYLLALWWCYCYFSEQERKSGLADIYKNAYEESMTLLKEIVDLVNGSKPIPPPSPSDEQK